MAAYDLSHTYPYVRWSGRFIDVYFRSCSCFNKEVKFDFETFIALLLCMKLMFVCLEFYGPVNNELVS